MRGKSVVEETMDGAGPVSEVMRELRTLEADLADPDKADRMDALLERFGEAHARSSPASASMRRRRIATSARSAAAGRCASRWRASS